MHTTLHAHGSSVDNSHARSRAFTRIRGRVRARNYHAHVRVRKTLNTLTYARARKQCSTIYSYKACTCEVYTSVALKRTRVLVHVYTRIPRTRTRTHCTRTRIAASDRVSRTARARSHTELAQGTRLTRSKAILINIIVSPLGILPPHLYILCAYATEAGAGRAARPGRPDARSARGRDRASARATDAVERWGVSDAARF